MTASAKAQRDSAHSGQRKHRDKTMQIQKVETIAGNANFSPRLSEFHLPNFPLMPDGARRFRLSPWHHPPEIPTASARPPSVMMLIV